MTKMISSAAVAVLAASPALAQPTLNAVYEGETAGGNNAFLFEIISDDLTGSYAIELGFEAAINDSLFNSAVAVDQESQTAGFDGLLGYTAEEDTYYFDGNFGTSNPGNNPFTGTETNGFIQTPTTLFMSFGSSTDQGSPVSVVRIVTPDESITYSGIIAQGGENFQVSGTANVPEPTTAALLAAGGLAILRRRRQQA
ncbi:PEP-CTERM sorting domain-containing protein [Algisphaera agarilytica]|nr:PEP-CTERM sorting domain-containing protein [Algisphaera agarilytica]